MGIKIEKIPEKWINSYPVCSRICFVIKNNISQFGLLRKYYSGHILSKYLPSRSLATSSTEVTREVQEATSILLEAKAAAVSFSSHFLSGLFPRPPLFPPPIPFFGGWGECWFDELFFPVADDEDLEDVDDDDELDEVTFEQWQVENPLKKQTEHWMAMAPSDFRSKVADCWRIISKKWSTSKFEVRGSPRVKIYGSSFWDRSSMMLDGYEWNYWYKYWGWQRPLVVQKSSSLLSKEKMEALWPDCYPEKCVELFSLF